MGVAATLAPKGLGSQNPTKTWDNLVYLLGQLISRKSVFKIFRPEPPLIFLHHMLLSFLGGL